MKRLILIWHGQQVIRTVPMVADARAERTKHWREYFIGKGVEIREE